MSQEKKSKKEDIERLRKILDKPGDPEVRKSLSKQDEHLESILRRLSSEPQKIQPAATKSVTPFGGFGSLEPRVIVHEKEEPEKEVKPPAEQEEKHEHSEQPLEPKEETFNDVDLYEIEKIEPKELKFAEVKPKKPEERDQEIFQETPMILPAIKEEPSSQPSDDLPEFEPVSEPVQEVKPEEDIEEKTPKTHVGLQQIDEPPEFDQSEKKVESEQKEDLPQFEQVQEKSEELPTWEPIVEEKTDTKIPEKKPAEPASTEDIKEMEKETRKVEKEMEREKKREEKEQRKKAREQKKIQLVEEKKVRKEAKQKSKELVKKHKEEEKYQKLDGKKAQIETKEKAKEEVSKQKKETKPKKKPGKKFKIHEVTKPVKKEPVGAEDAQIIDHKLKGLPADKKNEVFNEVPSIDDKTALLLIQHGYKSVEQLQHATVADLIKIKGIKRSVAKKIKKEIGTSALQKPKPAFVNVQKTRPSTPQPPEQEEVTEWESYYVDEETTVIPDSGGYCHGEYTLYKKEISHKKGKSRIIHFFSKEKPEEGEPIDLPEGYQVKVNKRTGLPYLKKKK